MPRSRGGIALIVPAIVVFGLLLPSAAFGQATRTWVSGVGDDVNPCSRTAPCKTFAGAISKTAAGGEINVIDPGGFGGVTITKSIAIRGVGATAGVLVGAGQNGIIINAGPTDRVTLTGLDIIGTGTGAQPGLTGIKVLNAGRVYIRNSEIYRFQAGIAVVPAPAAANTTKAFITGNEIRDNGVGVIGAPGNANANTTVVSLRNNDIVHNVCGAVLGAFGANATTPIAATNCGTAAPTLSENVNIHAFDNSISENDNTGVFSRGGTASIFALGRNDIVGNLFGIQKFGTTVRSFGDNHITDNDTPGTPSETVAPS